MATATTREWQPGMGEISGFGGEYENACRDMLFAGLAWLDEHPGANLQFTEYKNVYGLVNSKSQDAEALEAVVLEACRDCTGAMMHAVISHLFFIHTHSWEEYCAKMKERESAEAQCRRRYRRVNPTVQECASEFWQTAYVYGAWLWKRRQFIAGFTCGYLFALLIVWTLRASADDASPIPISPHAPGAEANPISADASGAPAAIPDVSAPSDSSASQAAGAITASAALIAKRANLARRDRLTDFVKAYSPRLSYEQCEAVVDVALTWTDYTWALACILAESGGDATGVNSSSGCRGYWQIHPCHKRAMRKLGLDFQSEADRCAFARVLYAKSGKKSWAASKRRTAKIQRKLEELK